MTQRLISPIINEMKSTYSLKSVAKRANVSTPAVCRVFKYVSYSLTKLPTFLSIDEFKGNIEAGKYQCIITDPHNRKDVKYFVMDMWKPYKDFAETFFNSATIVIDKYHFIRQAIWAFERVRSRILHIMAS